jgi:transcriptional antiterminator RfaH
MNRWYVIQTKPKKERDAGSYLSTKGVEIFSPLIETFSSRKGRVEKTMGPLFPNYIFGKFDLDENFPLVRWARGVKNILGYGGYPAHVSEEVVEIIKRRTDGDGIIRRTSEFEKDDVVRIKAGPLRDLVGMFDRWVTDHERVRILLNLIGYQPAIELHYSLLEKVA